jgi:serralysin
MAGNTKATSKSASGQPEPGDDKGGLLGGNGVDDVQPVNQAAAPPAQGVDDKGGVAGGQGVDDGAAHQARHFSWTDTGTHGAGDDDGSAYAGPVNYLSQEYVWSGHGGRAVASNVANVFIHGGDGDDAIAATKGSNVVDGGAGSNFLTGGLGDDGGTDTFYADVRGDQTVWDTVVNFHGGDAVTIWGFEAGTTSITWAENEGAEGFKGATLHAETHGAGTGINASVTFAGMSVADAQSKLSTQTGNVGGSSFMYLHNDG